jgi:hypothetical protein
MELDLDALVRQRREGGYHWPAGRSRRTGATRALRGAVADDAVVVPTIPDAASAKRQKRSRSISTAVQVTTATAAHIDIASRISITIAPFVERSVPEPDLYPRAPPRDTLV